MDWLKRFLRKSSRNASAVTPIVTRGWGDAECDACLFGNVYSFNWNYARSGKGVPDWPAAKIESFVLEQTLKAGHLYRCQNCNNAWYLDPGGFMMNSVQNERLPLIRDWSERRLSLTEELEYALSHIGRTSPDVYGNGAQYEEYPCAVQTTSDEFVSIAVVTKQHHAPFEHYRDYRLGSDIASIQPSDYALPLEVRLVTARAHEQRMGFAPTILETESGERLTANWTTNFIKLDGIDPSKIQVASTQAYFSDTPPILDEPKPVYFVVDS